MKGFVKLVGIVLVIVACFGFGTELLSVFELASAFVIGVALAIIP